MFCHPPAGTIVEISNIEGRPDKPVIRQILPIGHNLPDVKPGEQLQQQRAEVFQHVTTDGSWRRKTDQQIQEEKRVKLTADVAFLYTSCYLRYAEHINLWSAL